MNATTPNAVPLTQRQRNLFTKDFEPKYVRLYDMNKARVKPLNPISDAYTCVFTRSGDGHCHYVGFNANPFHPSGGIYQHGSNDTMIDRPSYKHLGGKIKFSDLPNDCKWLILKEYMDFRGMTTDRGTLFDALRMVLKIPNVG